jgi:hypothetical protein
MTELLCREEVYNIISCAIEVHGNLGSGFWKRFIRKRSNMNCD